MHKILLIIEREYLSRVKKKAFIIMTLLGPLLFAGITVIPAWLASKDSSLTQISVIDQSGLFKGKLKSNAETQYNFVNTEIEKEKKEVKDNGENHLLLIIGSTDGQKVPAVQIFGESNPSLDLLQSIENQINSELKNIQLKKII